MESLIHKLKQNNIDIAVVNDQLELSIPKGYDATELILEIKQNKQALIDFIKNIKAGEGFTTITPAPKKDFYVLSSAQKRLYFLQEMDRNSTAYNIQEYVRFNINLEEERVREVFDMLIARHESLRTSFHLVDGVPMQKVAEKEHIQLEYYETTEDQTPAIISNFVRPFDLSNSPLIRVGLVKWIAEQDTQSVGCLLMVDVHHIITDGISSNVLIKDVLALYEGKKLPSLKLQYKDYAEWQQSEQQQSKIIDQKNFWLSQFEGEVPSLQLPTDYMRPAVQSFAGRNYSFGLGSDISERLEALALQEGTTLFTVFLTICNIWLMKISQQEDIVIGSPTAGRNHSDLENIIGIFINTIALRNFPKGHKSCKTFLKEVESNFFKALDKQDYQFEDLINDLDIARDISRNPLFDVLLNVNEPKADNNNGDKFQAEPSEKDQSDSVAKFDISIYVDLKKNNFELTFLYKTELFKAETIKQLAAYFIRIADLVSTNPQLRINELSLLNETENQQFLQQVKCNLNNDEHIPCIQDTLLQSLSQHSQRTAIEYRNKHYSYAELDQHSTSIANHILASNIPANSYIGILCENRYNLIATIFGILKS